ncbi:MAG: AAA family ATPase [Anaerolineae bacterium]|nr:AAA family ATPase [Anaerolineae bacterium]
MSDLLPFSKEQLQTNVHAALRAWHSTGGTQADLLADLLLVQERQTAVAQDGSPASRRLATNQVLLEAIDELETQDQTAARVLRARFIDDNTLMAVANKLNVSEHSVSRLQRVAIEQLASILYGREQTHRQERAQQLQAQLPPATYTRLFGLEEAQTILETLLLRAETPWVIALVGIGGIGKTTLADAVARQALGRFAFAQVVWARSEPSTMSGQARSPQVLYEDLITTIAGRLWPEATEASSFTQRLSQVRQALKARPCLVIIDNLENETDTAYLLAHLHDLADPSKFLLTTRTRPTEQTAVFSFNVDELSPADAAALLHHHARDVGIQVMETATAADMAQIYQVVGGNPLALKLVVSLLDLLPLSQILTTLSHSPVGAVEEMYKHIYWQTWNLLSPSARQLLQAMPLVAESGGLPQYLHTLSGLPEAELWPALQELRHRSLLEVRGTLQEKRYGIHRLTETFLQTEIIHWPIEEIERLGD